MKHYFLENQPEYIKTAAQNYKLIGPEFVGQGCTEQCGSDSYGYYIVDILIPRKLVALVPAKSNFTVSYPDGHMTSEMPMDQILQNTVKYGNNICPDYDYIQRWGKKWYRCEIIHGQITRIKRSSIRLYWNGAHSYRDPHF